MSKKIAETNIKVHRGGDGLPPRNVFVNGVEIPSVVLADVTRGVVRFCPNPPRLKKGTHEIYTRELRGSVTVEWM